MVYISKSVRLKVCHLVLLGCVLLLIATLSQAAPVVPDAANIPRATPAQPPSPIVPEIKQQQKPALQPNPAGQTIQLVVHAFTFSGNQRYSSTQLSTLLSAFTGREIGLVELNQAAKVITDFYRKHGYFLAQAYLPAQDIQGQTVEIAILEGRLGELNIPDADHLNAARMREMLTYQFNPGDTVSEDNLVRNVSIVNALPAVRASAQLNPGEAVGTTDAEITLQPLPRWGAYMAANTYGNRFTGREVVLAGASLNHLAGVGDQLVLNLKHAKNDGQRGLQLAYYVPVHASGTLLNVGYQYVDYQLGGALKPLKAFGDSQYFNMGFDQPLMRNSQYGLTAKVGGAYKAVSDEVAAFAFNNHRDIKTIDGGLFADWLNDTGDVASQLGVNIRAGRVGFKNPLAESLDETGARTEGGFIKYNLTASRVQYWDAGLSVALWADYQATNKNLDSIEKLTIGGINRWRAFAELPSLADAGWMAGAEIRKKIPANQSLASLLLVEVSPYGFMDAGRGKLNQQASASDNHVKSIQYGVGLDLTFKQQWLFSMTASHQNRDVDGVAAENETRMWGHLQKAF